MWFPLQIFYGFGFFLILLLHLGFFAIFLLQKVFLWWSLLEGGTNLVFAESEIVDFMMKNLVGLVWFGLILWNWMVGRYDFGVLCVIIGGFGGWFFFFLWVFPSSISGCSSFPSFVSSSSSSSPTLYGTQVLETQVPRGLIVHVSFTELDPYRLKMLYS